MDYKGRHGGDFGLYFEVFVDNFLKFEFRFVGVEITANFEGFTVTKHRVLGRLRVLGLEK
jgi:hypothetical protein